MNKPKRETLSEALTNAATAVAGIFRNSDSPSTSIESTSITMSPGKRVRVSSQYLEQLEKIKQLHESGVLSSAEFQEHKDIALSNLKKINEM